MRTTVTLMSSSEYQWDVTGDPVKISGIHGFVDGKHTIAIYANSFIGRVWVEASLANDPTDNDWFPIHLDGDNAFLDFPFVQGGYTGTIGYTFTANVSWLRGRIDRSPYSEPPEQSNIALYGNISKILLNG